MNIISVQMQNIAVCCTVVSKAAYYRFSLHKVDFCHNISKNNLIEGASKPRLLLVELTVVLSTMIVEDLLNIRMPGPFGIFVIIFKLSESVSSNGAATIDRAKSLVLSAHYFIHII